jgi:hypothetical protein
MELVHGPIPPGQYVCHACDNPACVRPEHLFLGTQLDNMRDARRKGRVHIVDAPGGRGEQHYNAKLTWDQVREIRSRHGEDGATLGALAREFNVTAQQIRHIVHGLQWRETEAVQLPDSQAA